MNEYDIRVLIYTVTDELNKKGFDANWVYDTDRVIRFFISRDGTKVTDAWDLRWYARGEYSADSITKSLVQRWDEARRNENLNLLKVATYTARSCTFERGASFAVDFRPQIKKVIFNDPATIVFWKDGSKTITKCGELDVYDPEKGLAMCFAKKLLGNEGNYYNIFTEWLPKEEENDIEYGAPFDEPFKQVKEACNKLYDKITAGDGGH